MFISIKRISYLINAYRRNSCCCNVCAMCLRNAFGSAAAAASTTSSSSFLPIHLCPPTPVDLLRLLLAACAASARLMLCY